LLTFWLETGAKAEAEAAMREKMETTDLNMIDVCNEIDVALKQKRGDK